MGETAAGSWSHHAAIVSATRAVVHRTPSDGRPSLAAVRRSAPPLLHWTAARRPAATRRRRRGRSRAPSRSGAGRPARRRAGSSRRSRAGAGLRPNWRGRDRRRIRLCRAAGSSVGTWVGGVTRAAGLSGRRPAMPASPGQAPRQRAARSWAWAPVRAAGSRHEQIEPVTSLTIALQRVQTREQLLAVGRQFTNGFGKLARQAIGRRARQALRRRHAAKVRDGQNEPILADLGGCRIGRNRQRAQRGQAPGGDSRKVAHRRNARRGGANAVAGAAFPPLVVSPARIRSLKTLADFASALARSGVWRRRSRLFSLTPLGYDGLSWQLREYIADECWRSRRTHVPGDRIGRRRRHPHAFLAAQGAASDRRADVAVACARFPCARPAGCRAPWWSVRIIEAVAAEAKAVAPRRRDFRADRAARHRACGACGEGRDRAAAPTTFW